jgi:uncharacterized protein (DUF4213/DUF364 family)
LIELSSKAEIYLVGPSVPLNPLLFKYDLNGLSGTIITDYPAAVEAVLHGQCFGAFKTSGLLLNLTAPLKLIN